MDRELLVSRRQQRLEEGEGDGDVWHRGTGTGAPGKESESWWVAGTLEMTLFHHRFFIWLHTWSRSGPQSPP